MSLSVLLMLGSAGIMLMLGSAHMGLTFFSRQLQPRDAQLTELMRATSPMLTRQTSMWQAWVGFNASHSLGAMLFGIMFAYLAYATPHTLFEAPVLLGAGLAMLLAYVVLGWLYWFRVPLIWISLSLIFYLASILLR